MRPVNLEMEGFASFRERTVIDFEDAGLFCLFGPTGAGKSSILDAICFALYGAAPRYGAREVAPLLSQGMRKGTVTLEFTVGTGRYRALRMLRATKSGATTAEARLERLEPDPKSLAASASALTSEIEALLGLTAAQFQKAVALPQGAFAAFLQESAGERQQMLVDLLGLEIFGEIASRARSRHTDSSVRADFLEREIGGYESRGISEDAVLRSGQRVVLLTALREDLSEQQIVLDGIGTAIEVRQNERKSVAERMNGLGDTRPPAALGSLSRELQGAEAARDEAVSMHEKAAVELVRLNIDAQDLFSEEMELRERLREHGELGEARGRQEELAVSLAKMDATLAEVQEHLEGARLASQQAISALSRAEREHEAQAMRLHLVDGDECPVCLRVIDELPVVEDGEALSVLIDGSAGALKALERADDRVRSAEIQRAEVVAAAGGFEERVRGLEARLAGAASVEEINGRLSVIGERKAERAGAVAYEKRTAVNVAETGSGVEQAEKRIADIQQTLRTLYDRLRPLGAPELVRSGIMQAWTALDEWANAERERLSEELAGIDAEVQGHREKSQRMLSVMHDLCAVRGVELTGNSPVAAVSREIGAEEQRRERVSEGLSDMKRKQLDLKQERRKGSYAEALARLLGARAFQRWMMNSALDLLCSLASERLGRLSGGQYALLVDEDNSFVVKDFAAGGELRSVRTLSGGETFLTSLALALSLSENIAQMSASELRLESLFVDEGFGTLDAEALDIVASALEDVEASGRMVGVVTHVRELAERIPTRYKVDKRGGTSVVVVDTA